MSFFQTLFDRTWGKPQETQDLQNPAKSVPRRPFVRDWTDGCTVNQELTRGLWHNSYPGFKLAGALAFTPIAVPLWLMGLPVPRIDNEATQDELVALVAEHAGDCGNIHKGAHREGTQWVFPFYSATERRVVWEFIPDVSICDIVRDLRTGVVLKILTDEQLTITIGENQTAYARRKRSFSIEEIIEEWTEGADQLPPESRSVRYRNQLGIMPIPFTNQRDGDEVRGHSDYERILSDLKNYHDTDLALSEILVKYKPKLIQYVTDVGAWRDNNGIDTATLDIASLDFVLNLTDKERTEVLWPNNISEAHLKKLTQIFWKLVQGSGIPEIFWGTKVEGNIASADNQLDIAINYVKDKQNQKSEAYARLFSDTLRLQRSAGMRGTEAIPIEIGWNTLELIPESTKATIFASFSTGMAALTKSASLTKEQQYALWKRFYPSATEQEFEQYVIGLSEMSKHVAFTNSSYSEIADLKSEDDLLKDGTDDAV